MSGAGEGSDFQSLLSHLAQGYAPRPGAETAITQAIGAGGCVLLCGEPGSGKSVLAAHLIRTHAWGCYFVRVGHTEFSLWRDPYAFLTSVAFQLQAAFGDDIFPESVAITVEGQVRDVGRSGSVTGVDIERLVAVPWRRERLAVELDTQKIAGEVTGIRIREVVENYRSVPLPAFRELAWFEPLRRLRELRPQARFVLWVDGLDEEAVPSGPPGLAGPTPATIGALLPLASECRHLGNVTVIVSSRPGPHLDRFTADGATRLDLGAATLETDTGLTLTTVIDRELASPAVQEALAALAWPAADVRASLLGQSEQNFLFVRQYFEALRSGHGTVLRTGGFPQGLDDIHARLLSSLLRRATPTEAPGWLALLEVLAVAEAPLIARQLSRFAGTDENAIKATLPQLRPLLDETRHGEDPAFALYHQSLRECLLSARHVAERWRVEPAGAHRRIAQAYFDPGGTASQVDGYALLHGPTHLARALPEGPEWLFALLHEGWRKFARASTGSNRVFRHGLELARRHAATLAPVLAFPRTLQLALTDVYLRSAEAQIPDEALELMVRLGQVQRALENVPEGLEAVAFARRHRAIMVGLLAGPRTDSALAVRLLEQALRRLRDRAEWIAHEMSAALDAWPTKESEMLREVIPAIEAALDSWPTEQSETLRKVIPSIEAALPARFRDDAALLAAIARHVVALDPESANARLAAAFDAAKKQGGPEAGPIIGRVFETWAAFDPRAGWDHLMKHGSFPTTAESAGGFVALSLALEKSGARGALAGNAGTLLRLAPQPAQQPLEIAGIWLSVVTHAGGALTPESAAEVTDRVRDHLVAARQAHPAPEGKARPFLTDETALLVGLAVAERTCARGRHHEALAEAWEVVWAGASITDDDLLRLVGMQAVDDPDLLDACLHQPPVGLGQRLWFAVVRAGLVRWYPEASHVLESALQGMEKPRPTGWSFFFHDAARRCPLDQATQIEGFLANVGVGQVLIQRWRLALLRRMIAAGDSQAGAWWKETLRRWSVAKGNQHFIDELPAAIADLPVSWLPEVEIAATHLPSAKQRALLFAALAARHQSGDHAKALALFDTARRQPADPADQAEIRDDVVLAFLAGQMSACDPSQAETWWREAREALAARFQVDPAAAPVHPAHYGHACEQLRALERGAPHLALPALAGLRAPPPEPGARLILKPFPSVSAFRVGNLAEHEFLFGSALARAFSTHRPLVQQILAGELAPGARAFGLSQLARAAHGTAPPQRLAWCQQAAAAAQAIVSPPLRSLLLAECTLALAEAGARKKAIDDATVVAGRLLGLGPSGDTIVAHTYAGALGRCIHTAMLTENWTHAWDWLWEGRRLGMHAFHVLLGEVVTAMPAAHEVPFAKLEAAEGAGRNVFV